MSEPRPETHSDAGRANGRLAFGAFVYDPDGCVLYREDEVVELPPRAVQVFDRLLASRGELVEKEDLLAAGWPGFNVSDQSLAEALSRIREALGESAQDPVFIRTVPRRGYMFTGEVHAVATEPRAVPGPRRAVWRVAAMLALAALLVVAVTLWRPNAPTDGADGAGWTLVAKVPKDVGEGPTVAASLSPDGRRIAWVSRRNGALFVMDIGSGQTHQASDEPADRDFSIPGINSQSAWSPDGRLIAYDWLERNEAPRRSEIRLIDAEGSPPRAIRSENDAVLWVEDWHPAGTRLLVYRVANDSTEAVLGEVDPVDGAWYPIAVVPGMIGAAYAPDGNGITFAARGSRGAGQKGIGAVAGESTPLFYGVWVTDRVFRDPPPSFQQVSRRVTEPSVQATTPIWLPGGLVYATIDEALFARWLVFRAARPAGGFGEPVRLRQIGRLGYLVSKTPLGGALFTHTDGWFFELVSVVLDPSTLVVQGQASYFEAIRGQFHDLPVVASGDGHQLLAGVHIGNAALLAVFSRNTPARPLPKFNVRAMRPLGWGPDDAWVLYSGLTLDDERRVLYRVQPPRVSSARLAYSAPPSTRFFALAPDGVRLAMGRPAPEGDCEQLAVMNLNDFNERDLRWCGPIHDVAWSPDGAGLAVTTRDPATLAARLVVVPVDGGEPRALLEWSQGQFGVELSGPNPENRGVGTFQSASWSPDGRWIGVLVVSPRRQLPRRPHHLYAVPAAGGDPVEVLSVPPNHRVGHLNWLADNELIFLRQERFNEIWVGREILSELPELAGNGSGAR